MMFRFAPAAAFVLALAVPAAAEDLTLDRLKLKLPAGWTVEPAGVHRIVRPGGALKGKADILVFRSMEHDGTKSLDVLAKVFLTRIEAKRTILQQGNAKTSRTSSGLKLGVFGQRSKDAQGRPRYSVGYVFEVGPKTAQGIYVCGGEAAAFNEVNTAFAPVVDGIVVLKAAPKTAPKTEAPKLGPAITFDQLAVPLPKDWKHQKVVEEGKTHWTLSPPGGPGAQAYVFSSAAAPKGLKLTELAGRLLDRIDAQRQVAERGTAKTHRTPTGLEVVVLAQASKREGGSPRITTVYVFNLGARYQAVALLAAPQRILAARKGLETALPRAKAVGAGTPPPVATAPTPKAGGGSSAFADQGVLGTTSTAAVPQSAKLTPVAHKVSWIRKQSLSPQNHAVVYGTNKDGDVFWVIADKLVSRLQPREAQVLAWLKRGAELKASPATLPVVQKTLRATLGPGPKYGWEPYRFDHLETDRTGNLYMTVRLKWSAFPAVMHYRWDTNRMEVLAAPQFLQKVFLQAKLKNTLEARWGFHPTRQGSSGWLFLWAAYGPTYVIHHVRRGADGRWSARPVVPKFRDAAKYGTPGKNAIRHGAPDGRGGWVFYSGTAMWRLMPNGSCWPLAVFRFGSKSVWIPRPVVLDNGDVWFAINRRYDVTSSTDALNRTHTFALIGDRSRWVRVRLDGKGGVKLGEIDGKVLLASLRGAGAKLSGGVVKTLQPVPDPKTGGILAFDSHHELFYSIQPTD